MMVFFRVPPSLVGFLVLALLGRIDVLAQPSEACPNLQQRSLKVCDRCVHDDLCPMGRSGNYTICDPWRKKCVEANWTYQEIPTRCPEDSTNPSTWGAMCKLECLDQTAPFACAVTSCLHADFPCKWVPNCLPRGMAVESSACLRSCVDQESLLNTLFSVASCKSAIDHFGCYGGWQQISDFCPVSCNSPYCKYRCDRDEVPNMQGVRCYQQVNQFKMTCLQAIRQGQDCNCQCGSIYNTFAGGKGRGQGGAFNVADEFMGQKISLLMNVTAGQTVTIDLTGEDMATVKVADPKGPRMKLVPVGSLCSSAMVPDIVSGISCERPGGAGNSSVTICTTAPSLATRYLHRWRNIKFGGCGDFMVCHCNGNCDVIGNWNRNGLVQVRPVATWGNMAQPLLGCEAYLPTLAPPGPESDISDKESPSIVSLALSISGGLPPLDRSIKGVQMGLVRYLSTPSKVLNKQVPDPGDVSVTLVTGRLLIEDLEAVHPRRVDSCFDDDAAFKAAAEAAQLTITKCSDAFQFLKDVNKLCNDATLQTAVVKGCRLTCNLCTPDTTTTTPSIYSQVGNSTGTQTPTIKWPGGANALRLTIQVTVRTDLTGDVMMSRLAQLADHPETLIQSLFIELSAAGLLPAEIPGQMWVYVAVPPTRTVVPTQAPPPPPVPTWTTSKIIIVIAGVAGGGSCCLSAVAAFFWWYCHSSYHTKVGTESRTEVSVSDGGYRLKKKFVAGTEAEQPLPTKWEVFWAKLSRRLFPEKKLRRVAPVAQDPGGALEIGTRVRLIGLSQAHFNGLTGFVTGGPNDKGRYTVEVIVDDDDSAREIQTLSFKPDNLRPLPPEWMLESPTGAKAKNSHAEENPGLGLKSSYRSGKT